MPSDKTSLTSLWNPHRGKVKGEMEVEFLPTCGAAQEKQSAAALPSSTPPALPWCFVWGFLAAGHDGRHSENWLSGNPTVQPAVLAFRYPRGLPGLESLTQ